SNARPKPSLDHPDKFNGSPHTWETWHASIKAKLRIDADSIGGPEAQFYYVFDRLDGKTQSLLIRLHEDPNSVQDSEDKLNALRQEDQPLGMYLAKFERLLYKSKAID
ncbi:hypothetical protein QBC35DRAFT_363847, partial [Podospora australis]